MWKRDQAAKPPSGQPAVQAVPSPQVVSPQVVTPPISQAAVPVAAIEPTQSTGRSETRMVNIGKSVVIKGELKGSEDLTIEGQVEGTIELKENVLTIGPNGRIKAQVFAKTVIILGTVHGNVTASEKVDIRDGASVAGDVAAPRVAIAEGAQFQGGVDMQRGAKLTQQSNVAAAAGTRPSLVTPSTERDQAVVAAASTH
jgi:cytoskeletal protein CcmA (bactofilin family)